MIAPTAVIGPAVRLGERVSVEDYCVIGANGETAGDSTTLIGDDSLIRAFTIIYPGNRIGGNFRTGNRASIREHNEIGDNVSIGTMTVIEHHVTIGDGVRIHSGAFVPEYSILKRNSWIGPGAILTNARFPRSPEVKDNLVGVTLEEDAIVGANSTLLPGVTVGAGSLVGAGSVVTSDVPAGMIVAGCPAQVLRERPY